jgi:hypothetical protein
MVPPEEPAPVTPPEGVLSPPFELELLRSMMAVQPGPAKPLSRAVAHKPHRIWDSSSLLMALWLLTVWPLWANVNERGADANQPIRHHRWQAFGCCLLTT